MPQFSWLQFSTAKADLALRLADPNKIFWVDDELARYIIEALRTYNALVSLWNTDYALNVVTPVSGIWYPMSAVAGYPRQRTVTDSELEILMQYHLLEPGGNAVGPGLQFAPAMLSAALQRRRDEIIQLTAANVVNSSVAAVPNIRRTNLPDTVLEVFRNRYVPTDTTIAPTTLWRDDDLAFSYYEPGYLQNESKIGQQPLLPQAYSLITGPPLAFDVNVTPPAAGVYDLLNLKSGVPLVNGPTVLGLPNDWCWVDKWGALADMLGQESECTDIPRAKYCLDRYTEGVKQMAAAPWLLMGALNGVAVDTVSVTEMDQYAAEWDSDPDAPQCLVTAGTDLLAISPVPTVNISALLTLVQNAPIPAVNNDFVQVSRDTYDVILDYAQHLAMFKEGGTEFAQSMSLFRNFVVRCASENGRIKELGLYRDILLAEGNREKQLQPRFEED